MKLFKTQKASALVTVIMITGVMAVLTASLLKYSTSERRFNERQRMLLRSRNMAENVAVYASEQITNKLYRLRSFNARRFTGTTAIDLPPNDVLTSSFSTPSDVEVVAGLTYTSPLTYIDPTLAVNANNPNAGLQISTSTVPIIAKSTMTHSSVGAVTTYAEQDLEVSIMPLFQFAIFYNMDLEFGPGPNMTISGPVHTNGDFISRIQSGFANTIRFTERVTAAKGFYANTGHRGPTYMADGSSDVGPGGSGPLIFRKPTEAVTAGTDIKSSAGIWRDHKWTSSTTPNSVPETATTQSQFRSFATSTYSGNLRTSLHGVTKLVLPSIGDYDESTPEGRKNGRQIIDPPMSTDQSAVYGTKFARNAGLYIVVNPDTTQRSAYLPNGTTVAMRPRSYRAWLNTPDESGSNAMTEVVLPGQPSYGALNATVNYLPNAYRVDSSLTSNQVLRIPKGGGGDLPDTGYSTPTAVPAFPEVNYDAYFYDIRRAFNNTGYPYARSGTNSFRPRPIAKIDLDLTRLKMAVQRTLFNSTNASVFYPGVPNNDNWDHNVLNASATPDTYNMGIAPGSVTDFSSFPDYDTVATAIRSQNGNYAPLVLKSWTRTGTAAPAIYSGRYVVAETSDPTTGGSFTNYYNSTADESMVNYTPRAASTFVRVRLYTAGTVGEVANNLLDEQFLPIVPDLAPITAKAGDGYTTARFIVAETTSTTPTGTATWTNRYTSSADEASVTFTPTSSAVTGIRIQQYAPGGTSTLIRAPITPVVIPTLTNEYHTVPTLALFLGPIYANAMTDMRVFVGGVDDSDNWTYTAATVTGTVTGSMGSASGPFSNRYSVTAMTTNDATVRITAAKTGFTSVSKIFTLRKQAGLGGIALPLQTTRWISAGRVASPDPFRIYFAGSGAAVSLGNVVTSGVSPWFDGVTIYLHSVGAEDLSVTGTNNSAVRNRVSSGVRLWNGRGPVVSLPASTYSGRTGFSFATNDAIYVMGHFNADGTINSTLSSTGTGGYSGRYPESTSEMLASVMGDGINIYSQPEFTREGSSPAYRYYQSSGWSDSLSANRRDDSANYSTTWASTNPSPSNTLDGINTSTQPALMPNLTVDSAEIGSGPRPTSTTLPSTRTAKFAPSETEISACLLTGIVPTTKTSSSDSKQTSGGVHNFPRLSENWAGSVALYIRGSLVAMFESQVGTEPWGIRWYQGAIRNWGLHENLRNANHDVPLEPIVLGARRMSYRDLSRTEYNTMKATIEALAVSP